MQTFIFSMILFERGGFPAPGVSKYPNFRFNSTVKDHEKQEKKKGSYFHKYLIQRAENGTQTRDPQLGRQPKDVCKSFEIIHTFLNFVVITGT